MIFINYLKPNYFKTVVLDLIFYVEFKSFFKIDLLCVFHEILDRINRLKHALKFKNEKTDLYRCFRVKFLNFFATNFSKLPIEYEKKRKENLSYTRCACKGF